MMFIKETWLRSSGDEIKCNDLTRPGYTLNSLACDSRGGGIALLAKNSVAHRIKYKSKFTFNHATFELIHATILFKHQTVNIFCLYRSPPSRKNKLSFILFLGEFSTLLEFRNSIAGSPIILGDFNLHFDQPNSPNV